MARMKNFLEARRRARMKMRPIAPSKGFERWSSFWDNYDKTPHGNLLVDFGGKRLKIGRI